MLKILTKTALVLFVFLMSSCATYQLQVNEEAVKPVENTKSIAHSFYLIGDAGNSPIGTKTQALQDFEIALKQASKNSTAIFLGDNIYPHGMPDKNHKQREFAEHQLNVQIEVVKDFKGQVYFIPGNHDWYSNGLKGLERQEDYIKKALGKDVFLPENGCAIEKESISDEIELIIIDSKWYLSNWDKHPLMNDDCEIKTREGFFDEYESRIKKARGKTTVVAMHHPMYTNGPHDGNYSFADHLKPIPVLGTLKNILRSTTGISPEDLQNKRYNEFRKRIIALSQFNDKVIFVSGHEHNLQYIVEDNLHQIISGSGSKLNPTKNKDGGVFSYGANGYAKLDVYTDGTSSVQFYSSNDQSVVFETTVIETLSEKEPYTAESEMPKTVQATIYSKEETTKSNFYKKLWGERYRDDYSRPITANTVNLDTLFGGLIPVRKGGGVQSNTLRLQAKDGREYVMRALRKSATRYIQSMVFRDEFVGDDFKDTAAEELISDVFTGAHPYAPFVMAELSDAVSLLHTNPVVYYVPKQSALYPYNDEFGDELYMIEEHAGDGHGDTESFGFSNELISSLDLLNELREDEDIVIDERMYIRARIFDMLIGDWDRHDDQWRWAKTKREGKTVYLPMPRDRDQVFSVMNDGWMLQLATTLIPSAKLLRGYDDDIKSVKWFNTEPYPLDVALIRESNKAVWDAETQTIIDNITDEVIENAFKTLPEETQGANIEKIKETLKARRSNLNAISDRYYYYLQKYAVITGTDKDDWFDIERLPNGETKVTGYRIKSGEKADIFHEHTYTKKTTKEIWIYALDDKDVFHTYGDGNKLITVRLIGGQNNDTYNTENGKKVTSYDFKSKNNTYPTTKGTHRKVDDFDINNYHFKKFKNNSLQIVPLIGFNPDDGVKLGVANTYTSYGFERNPFSSQHKLAAAYFFATSGFEVNYSYELAHVFHNWNFQLEATVTTPNFAINFFGLGNQTTNPEADDDGLDVDFDFNRVKLRTLIFNPKLIWRGEMGATFAVGASYEDIEVENTQGRFINTFLGNTGDLSEDFLGLSARYEFQNLNNKAFPTSAFTSSFELGYKTNLSNSDNFTYAITEIGISKKLFSENIVFGTKSRAHLNFSNDFLFYQGATAGANTGLRGFRNERFTGKNSFVQTSDLRFNITKLNTVIAPMYFGMYGGFDLGRVWLSNDNSDKWHNSYGGGLFFNVANLVSSNLSVFNSVDGIRVAFQLGFDF